MNIILSPHFDDATLSLGGLLAREGSDTLVATFFGGTPPTPLIRPWDVKCGFADSDAAMRARTEENKKSLYMFGVADERIRNYAHLDAEYRFERGEPRIPEPELETSLRGDITALLREFTSGPLKVFMPGLELHTDHALVKSAALTAFRTLPPNSDFEFFFYQDLPYALKIPYQSLEDEVTKGSFAVSVHPIPLTRAEMEKKVAGAALYASQVHEHLLEKLEQFAAAPSRSLSLSAPYCEVAYAWHR